ncbi:hypothetical protein CCMSSC00406_0010119 [Pleurotus cornucopiae]|uniref:Uncharacterized protein n=1 Tax=Pleurotus cornucopiae TaxID=5321 RepID=A0ACB7IH08_PLECO|nr:hypothetical protein CCMSSC00406_0010119 [Pleurotus cornucopiae]
MNAPEALKDSFKAFVQLEDSVCTIHATLELYVRLGKMYLGNRELEVYHLRETGSQMDCLCLHGLQGLIVCQNSLNTGHVLSCCGLNWIQPDDNIFYFSNIVRNVTPKIADVPLHHSPSPSPPPPKTPTRIVIDLSEDTPQKKEIEPDQGLGKVALPPAGSADKLDLQLDPLELAIAVITTGKSSSYSEKSIFRYLAHGDGDNSSSKFNTAVLVAACFILQDRKALNPQVGRSASTVESHVSTLNPGGKTLGSGVKSLCRDAMKMSKGNFWRVVEGVVKIDALKDKQGNPRLRISGSSPRLQLNTNWIQLVRSDQLDTNLSQLNYQLNTNSTN